MVTLVLNSPWVDEKVLRRLARKSVLVGVDGGLNSIARAGLVPDWALGDFDSVQSGLLERLPRTTKILRFPVEKDYTDIELALRLARVFQPTYINILGLGGGTRLDHQVVNCIMLSNLVRSGYVVRAWAGPQSMVFTSATHLLFPRQGRHFSVFTLSDPAVLSIYGAKYPIPGLKQLLPGSGYCLGNEILGKYSVIRVKSGIIAICQWNRESQAGLQP